MNQTLDPQLWQALRDGMVIPACPLALTSARKFDEQRQRALIRYYVAAGAGGVAVGVHTTQFAIRDARFGLFQPILELTAEELRNQELASNRAIARIGGIVGKTPQACREAQLLQDFGFQAGLLSLAGHDGHDVERLVEHCRSVAEIIPIIGFYLQPAVGGPLLAYRFWREFAEIENVVAIKIAPFNRYYTFDVVRAVVEAGRDDIALYTGNDDNIVCDLLTEFVIPTATGEQRRSIAGGLLGHWACWTQRAVQLLDECKRCRQADQFSKSMLTLAAQVTDCNAALFDVANNFAGCIPGIHEVLRRQGLLAGTWCLDPAETLGPGQAAEIDRVSHSYPQMNDDAFVAEHLDQWLA